MTIKWIRRRKGHGTIYTADGVDGAIVDNHGMGFNPGIFWRGKRFASVADAKAAAERANAA